MKLFAFVSSKIYSLDVLLPIVQELKALRPALEVDLIFDRTKDVMELGNDKSRLDNVNELGTIRSLGGNTGHSVRLWASKIARGFTILRLILEVGLRSHSVIIMPKQLMGWRRLLAKCNACRGGQSYCYLLVPTPGFDNMVLYFDSQGQRRVGLKPRAEKVNVGDGLLAYHPHGQEYLNQAGYKKLVFIGYPMMYESFLCRYRDKAMSYVRDELCHDHTRSRLGPIVSIFLNKYQSIAFYNSNEWAANTLKEAVVGVREHYPDSLILIRCHPMMDKEKVRCLVARLEVSNVRFTDLNVYVLSHVSKFVISIHPSTSVLQVLACGTPVVEYGLMPPKYYQFYPHGTAYPTLGVQVAKTPTELDLFIKKLPEAVKWLDEFKKNMFYHANLKILFGI